MPRDLFGEVGSPSVRVGTRSRYTVPLSLAVHAAVILAVAAAAVFGPVVLPGLASSEIIYEVTVVPPAPPPPAPHPSNEPPPVRLAHPNAAPTAAPDHIAPEAPMSDDAHVSLATVTGIIPGVTDFSTVVGEPPAPPPAPPVKPVPVGGRIRPPTRTVD